MLFDNLTSSARMGHSTGERRYRFNIAAIRGKGAERRFRIVDHEEPLGMIDGKAVKKLIFVSRVLTDAEMRTFDARVDAIIRDIQRGVPDSVIQDRIKALVATWGGTPAVYAADGGIETAAVAGPMRLAEVQEEYRPSGSSASRPAVVGTTKEDINSELAD